MISFSVKVEHRFERIASATEKAAFRNFGHAAASIRKTASRSIRRGKNASRPGQPPRTRDGQLRRSLRFSVSEEDAIIGPRYSFVGEAGAAHEFGGSFRGQQYPARPFMLPALQENLGRFASEWRGSIGE